jgi:hypothetical protein
LKSPGAYLLNQDFDLAQLEAVLRWVSLNKKGLRRGPFIYKLVGSTNK